MPIAHNIPTKRSNTESTIPNLFQVHVPIILASIGGAVVSVGIILASTYFWNRRRRQQRKLQTDDDKLAIRGDPSLPNSTNRPGYTSFNEGEVRICRIKPHTYERELPRTPDDNSDNYATVGFGNCGSEQLEPISGNQERIGRVVPGDVAIPSPSLLRDIHKRSENLPTRAISSSRLQTVGNWRKIPIYQAKNTIEPELPHSNLTPKDGERELASPVADSRRTGNNELGPYGSPAIYRSQASTETEARYELGFDKPQSISVDRKTRLKSNILKDRKWASRHRCIGLRKFGDFSSRRASTTISENLAERRSCSISREICRENAAQSHWTSLVFEDDKRTKKLDSNVSGRDHKGYAISLISEYRKGPESFGTVKEAPDMYLWKPLPKPPVERIWGGLEI